MKSNYKDIAELIKKNITQVDPNSEIILYGSRARGEEHAHSDWDILVLTDYPVDINVERNFRNNLFELELQVGQPFSIFVYSKEDWLSVQSVTPFYINVMRDGVQL